NWRMGWPMGLEPTTTGITIRDSTLELRPPSCTQRYGLPGGTRTHNPQLRRLVLYPVELRADCVSRHLPGQTMVGVERFELPTSCSQSRRATRLRHTPRNPKKGRNDTPFSARRRRGRYSRDRIDSTTAR